MRKYKKKKPSEEGLYYDQYKTKSCVTYQLQQLDYQEIDENDLNAQEQFESFFFEVEHQA